MAVRRPQFLRTLQARVLLALVLIGLLPLGLVGLGIATLDRQALTEQSARELTGLARGLAGQLSVYLDGLLSDSRAIAALPMIVSMDAARHDVLLKELFLHYHAFARLGTFDRTGQPLASSHAGTLPAMAAQASFQTAVRHGQQAWMVASALPTDRSALLIHTPIRDADRRVVGVVGGIVDLGELTAVVGRVQVGGGGQAFVLDAAGRVLLHPDRAVLQERRDYSWLGMPTDGRLTGSGIVRYRSGGERHIAGYASVPNVSWTVLAEQPETEVLAPVRRSWYLALAGLATSACLALLTAVFLARTLTRPVRQLVAAVRAFGAGNATAPLPAIAPGDGEFGTLVNAFMAMRQAITERERSERQQAEAALQQSEERYRSLIENSFQGLYLHQDGIVQFANPAMARTLGYASPHQLIGRDYREFVAPHDAARLEGYRVAWLRGDPAPASYEFQGVRKDGSLVWLACMASRVLWHGRPATMAAFLDLTERKQAEAALQHSQEQLQEQQQREKAQVEAELAKVRNQLISQTRLATLGQVAGTIAHELRNPLGAVRNAVYYLRRYVAKDHADLAEFLRVIDVEVDAANQIISNLLEMTRAKQPLVQTLNLAEVAAEVFGRLQQPGTVCYRWVCEPDPFLICADPAQFRQVLMNLMTNAVQAMQGTGEIVVMGCRTGSWDTITLHDNGPGVPPEARERLFEPLFSTRAKGTGLGLAICRQIVEKHGGTIALMDSAGGAAFRIRLPRQSAVRED